MIVRLHFVVKHSAHFENKWHQMAEIWSNYFLFLIEWMWSCEPLFFWCDCSWLSLKLQVKLSELKPWQWVYKNCGEQCEIDIELINLYGKENMNQKEKEPMKEWMKDERVEMYKKL